MEKQTSALIKMLHLIVFVLFFSFIVVGCGGGGGGDTDNTTPTPSSNWDAMDWDQGNWQ